MSGRGYDQGRGGVRGRGGRGSPGGRGVGAPYASDAAEGVTRTKTKQEKMKEALEEHATKVVEERLEEHQAATSAQIAELKEQLLATLAMFKPPTPAAADGMARGHASRVLAEPIPMVPTNLPAEYPSGETDSQKIARLEEELRLAREGKKVEVAPEDGSIPVGSDPGAASGSAGLPAELPRPQPPARDAAGASGKFPIERQFPIAWTLSAAAGAE